MVRFRPCLAAVALVWAALAPPAAAADLYSVENVPVEATAPSATQARDAAMAQGRPIAWQTMYRRLVPEAEWSNLPVLSDLQLQRLIRSADVGNERRSTTRYLATITYHFNPDAVQRLLRQNSVAFAEASTRPVLVVPVIDGRYDAASGWTLAWDDPSLSGGLVPIVIPDGGGDMPVLSRPDLAQASWPMLSGLAARYNAAEIVVAQINSVGNSVTLTQISPTGRSSQTIDVSGGSFPEFATAASQSLQQSWTNRSAIDYSRRATLSAVVRFASQAEWIRIRNQIADVRTVADFTVNGLSIGAAAVDFAYVGRPAQLRDALAQQGLALDGNEGAYTLRLSSSVSAR